MDKLHLRLDDLTVNSFHVDNISSASDGTVRGQVDPGQTIGDFGCGDSFQETCGLSCVGTCADITCFNCTKTDDVVCGA
jgi:hypothetical protein